MHKIAKNIIQITVGYSVLSLLTVKFFFFGMYFVIQKKAAVKETRFHCTMCSP